MKTKKMFGIGAVVLMILVAVIPAINGMQLSTEEENKENIQPTGYSGDWEEADLSITFEKCYLAYSVWYEPCYMIKYAMTNHGPDSLGLIIINYFLVTYDKDNNPYMNVSSWSNTMNTWEVGETKYVERLLEIPADEERFFAGHKCSLSFVPSPYFPIFDNNSENNIDYGVVRHWSEDSDYIPTEPQVEASNPIWYEKEYCVPEIPDLYDLSFFDTRILPNILESKRMGWAGQASKYLAMMGANITALLGATVAFLLLVKNDIKIVTQWMVDFIEWFYATAFFTADSWN